MTLFISISISIYLDHLVNFDVRVYVTLFSRLEYRRPTHGDLMMLEARSSIKLPQGSTRKVLAAKAKYLAQLSVSIPKKAWFLVA